jgi:hypothetical protein
MHGPWGNVTQAFPGLISKIFPSDFIKIKKLIPNNILFAML